MHCWHVLSLSYFGFTALLLTPTALAEKITYSTLKNGDVITVTLDQLLPTQAVLDYDAEYAKLQYYANDRKHIFDTLCRVNGAKGIKKWDDDASPLDPESYTCKADVGTDVDALSNVIIGPEEGILYLVDHLTVLSSFWDMPNGGTSVPVMVKISHNLLASGDDFWAEMNNDREVWLRNYKGKKISPDDLPEYIGLKQLKHDKYLSLVNFLDGISYAMPKPDGKNTTQADIPFLALHWALALRKKMKISDYNLNDPEEYATAITEAATIMVDTPDDQDIGLSKRTAKEMGKFDQVDSEALEKLLTDKDSAFSLAMAYRLAKKEKSTPKSLMVKDSDKKDLDTQDAKNQDSDNKGNTDKDGKKAESSQSGTDKQTKSPKADNDQPNAINETTEKP
ncbi:ParB/Srx family N-terminal domain-containing protein [Photobacterium japonica]|uniref:ParB/Srx family N-terminal domain-containing protein n=1 Tax=Photobacterium japonica TaxID=2910235 RepID=UPI003D12EB26